MNQSEVFLFLTNYQLFLLEVVEKTLTNKKTLTVLAFSIFNQKNENKDKDKL